MKKQNIIIIIMAIVILALISFIAIREIDFKKGKKSITEYLVISINPRLMIGVNDDKITNLYKLNEDADVFDDNTIVGKSLEDGIKNIIKVSKENNFVKDDTIVNVSYYGNHKNDNAISKVTDTIKSEGVSVAKYEINNTEYELITTIKNQTDEKIVINEEINKEENAPVEENKENTNTNKTSNSNKTNNTTTNTNNTTTNTENTTTNSGWTNIGGNTYIKSTTIAECKYSMRGYSFTVPSWFKLYPGDRFATKREYDYVNPASNLVVIVKDGYGDITNVTENRNSVTFLQFLPDNIECLKSLCDEGDKDCYQRQIDEKRGQLKSEKKDLQNYENDIAMFQKNISDAEPKLQKLQDEYNKYCKNMTDETIDCFYVDENGQTQTYYENKKRTLEYIDYYEQIIEGAKQQIEFLKREAHYRKLRVYEQEQITNYVLAYFKVEE